MTADCLKLTSYFGERHRSGGSFTADALIELYGRHEIAASILLRGTEGFGLKHHLRTDRSLTLSEDLPLTAIAVDTRSRIETVLPQTVQLNRAGLVTSEIIPAMRASADDRQRGGTRLATHHLPDIPGPDIPDPDIPDPGRGDGRD